MLHVSKKQLIVIVAVLLAVAVLATGMVGLLATKSAVGNAALLPSGYSWVYQPQANSTNAALLTSAKLLMKEIYYYQPDEPDYLPTSYSNEATSLTHYVVHAANPTNVSWAPVGESQVTWQSMPYGKPTGWSGTITEAGQASTPFGSAQVFTDCSGFITSLFAYANTLDATKFTGWQSGNCIPEAGCFDPDGAMNNPNPLNYYHLFVSGENGWFEQVSLADLQPGDIIAWANTANTSDTGHIMYVIAVSNGGDNSASRYVVVMDETGTPHSFDSRLTALNSSGGTEGGGIGMGIARLAISSQDELQFFWNMTSSTPPQIGAVALGRAM